MSKAPKDPGMAAFSDEQPPPPAPEPEGPIDPTDPSEPRDQLEADAVIEDPGDDEGPVFDIEAFVRSLPDGVGLCPTCLGIGAFVADPPFDPHAHICPVCLGYGKVRTGSLVGGQGDRDCAACSGRGWVDDEPDAPPAVPAMAAHFEPEARPTDQQGRTPDDPDFDWSKVIVSPVAGEHEPATEPAAAAL